MSGPFRLAATLMLLAACASPARAQPTVEATAKPARVLESFEEIAPWRAVASDGVAAVVDLADGVAGKALRLNFDFAGGAGYAAARREIPIDFPPNYEISFYVRGDAPVNNLEFKLIDAAGDSVWWVNRRDFQFSREWRLVRIKRRQIEFAWGPARDRTLRHSAALELVVSAGSGGRGSVYFDQLTIRELPAEPAIAPAPTVQASSFIERGEPWLAFDGEPATSWRSDPAQGPRQSFTIDFKQPREFGGLVVRWLKGAFASRYDVELSDDGIEWRTVRRVTDGNGGRDALLLTESEARFLRLALHDGPARAYGIAEIEVRDLAFGASVNAFFEAMAREAPRGQYPRGFAGEQPYWTLVGIDGGPASGLLSEDGALEVARGGFSIEPFVVVESRVVSWADVKTAHALAEDYLPIPSATWRDPRFSLAVTAFASGDPARSRMVARYELKNLTARALPLELVLAVRPLQVNPPAQFLNAPGGVSEIRDLAWDGARLSVNGEPRVFPLQAPDRVGAGSFDSGFMPAQLGAPAWAPARSAHDEFGYASAALAYRVTLAPHGSATVGLVVPLSGAAMKPDLEGLSPRAWMGRQEKGVAAAWRAKLNRVALRVPAAGKPLADTLRSSLAHILVSRDGPMLRPGTRSYARSWIRDGAMMSEGLLRLGHAGAAADYLRWYAKFQFPGGKVPCCVDARGADPVPENDSHGELIFLAAELYRYTRDRAALEAMWPRVEAAARYMEELRQSERTEGNRVPGRRRYYGLLPASISHEGYSEKPMHSYWDDFWALVGYEDAVAIASWLGKGEAMKRLALQRDEFRGDLYASLAAAIAAHGIDYLPGSAELGDFDPTSTTIALAPGREQARLPEPMLHATFERYWSEFVERRDGARTWDAYTPYEIRAVGTFVRLGWRARAIQLMDAFMADRRPAAWNQWAEVVGRDARKPRFVGDMPHGWIASDFIRSALDLFAYERERDHALVVGAGVPLSWLDGSGVSVKNLRTPYGMLGYTLRRRDERVVLHVARGSALPPGGVVYIRVDGTELKVAPPRAP